MSDRSKIEWTDATWNPIRGCSRVSEGCRNCYAERIATRFSGPGQPYEALARRSPQGAGGWTGEVRFIPELLDQPLHWKRPRKIFVNSMSDLFHEKVDVGWIDQIVAAMMVTPHHTFQVLTKRPERMRNYLCNVGARQIEPHMQRLRAGIGRLDWPWRNIWWGVSVEDQKTADDRIPLLLQTPAAVRWVSYEPALGPVDFWPFLIGLSRVAPSDTHLDWLVAGGESGPGARPSHPDWFRAVRDQCAAANMPFFFKQWGEWTSCDQHSTEQSIEKRTFRGTLVKRSETCGYYCCEEHGHIDHGEVRMIRVGKKRAGHRLDGAVWQQFPAVAPNAGAMARQASYDQESKRPR
jgi:protein gp37